MSAITTRPNDLWWAPVWERHRTSYAKGSPPRPAREAGLRHELIFCLLGGHGVTFELALSATEVILRLSPFNDNWTSSQLRAAIEGRLRKPQFEPRRADGTLRCYRFPGRKARLIAEAVAWVTEQGGIARGLAARTCERDRRSWLCQCPGIGLKTASWLLRNSGWAKRLAILDVHLIRALEEANVVAETRLPRDYELVEAAYLAWADSLGACPSALDLFLWEVQRARSAPLTTAEMNTDSVGVGVAANCSSAGTTPQR
jgi:thermostable 8-oxoguanine DNA glycosylase